MIQIFLIIGLLMVYYRNLRKDNANYKKKIEELTAMGGTQVSTDIFTPLVTNRERFPNAPEYLPHYILINDTILVLKKNSSVLKYSDPEEDMTNVILFEPWKKDDFGEIIDHEDTVKKAKERRYEVFPFATKFQ